MSQATQSLPLKHQLSAHRLLAVSALLALLATTAVVLVLTIDVSTQTSAPAGQSTHPRTVWNGRPFGSRAVESIDSRPSPGPDESSIAAAIGSASEPATAGRPDESKTATAIGSGADSTAPDTGSTCQSGPCAPSRIRAMTPAEPTAAFRGHR